jgi:hypothetical protein
MVVVVVVVVAGEENEMFCCFIRGNLFILITFKNIFMLILSLEKVELQLIISNIKVITCTING